MVLYHSNKLSFAELLRGKIYFLRDHFSKRILATFSSGELKGLKLLLINDYITLTRLQLYSGETEDKVYLH